MNMHMTCHVKIYSIFSEHLFDNLETGRLSGILLDFAPEKHCYERQIAESKRNLSIS